MIVHMKMATIFSMNVPLSLMKFQSLQ